MADRSASGRHDRSRLQTTFRKGVREGRRLERENANRMTDLLIRLHEEGTLSEGQVARATGLHRITVRKLADKYRNAQPVPRELAVQRAAAMASDANEATEPERSTVSGHDGRAPEASAGSSAGQPRATQHRRSITTSASGGSE